jgi:V/A-type H+-transporting ATPase subunit C
MVGSEDPKYAFVIGRVRAREARLLTRQRFDQLSRLGSEAEILRSLSDTYYGELSGESLVESLAAARREAYDFFTHYCLDPWAVEGLKLRWDFYNLKAFVKAQFAEADPNPFFSSQGNYPLDVIQGLMTGEGETRGPRLLQDGLAQALAAYYEAKRPAAIDFTLDQCWFEALRIRTLQNRWLSRYLQVFADLANLLTLVRFKYLERPSAELGQTLLRHGTIPVRAFSEIYPEAWDGIVRWLGSTPYGRLCDGVTYLTQQGSFARQERLTAETKLSFLKRTRYFTFGIEPLIAYYLFKEAEVKNLSRIGFGIAQGVEISELRERIAWVD